MRTEVAGALVLTGLLLAGAARASPPPGVGDSAPQFTLPDLTGRQVALASFLGRPVLLHFWATWCPVCREEMPLLDEAARGSADRVTVLGVNLGERRDTVEAYVQAENLGFPMLLDRRGRVAALYRVVALPATIVIDARGRIARVIRMGALTREGLEEILDRPAPDPEGRSVP